jgi:putative transposase
MEATMNVLHHHTIDELRTLYRTEADARMARRIQAVWLARQGLTCQAVMDVTGAAQRTVFDWIAKYNRGGIDELLDRPRSGRPMFLDAGQLKQLAERIEAGPVEKDVVSVFNAATVDQLVEKEFGVLYSLRGIQLLLGRMGFSYQCPRPVHENSDPEVQEAFKKNFPKGWKPSPPSIPTSESRSTSKTKPVSVSKAH